MIRVEMLASCGGENNRSVFTGRKYGVTSMSRQRDRESLSDQVETNVTSLGRAQ